MLYEKKQTNLKNDFHTAINGQLRKVCNCLHPVIIMTTYTYTNTHVYTHTHTHTRIYTHTHTHVHTHHTRTHTSSTTAHVVELE